MKKFCIKICLFLVLTYSVSLIIDIGISKIAQPRGEFSSWKDLYDNNINADLLVFGSSRAMNQFNIQIIEDSLNISAYNLGLSSARIEMSLLRLIEHLRVCSKKPTYVTLEIDWLTIDNERFLYTPWQIFPYMFLNRNMYKYTHHFKGYYTHFYVMPLARYGKYLTEIIKNRERTYSSNETNWVKGYVAIKRIWNERSGLGTKEVSIYHEEIQYLLEFVNICKSHQIKLNFVYAPEYLKATKIVKNRDMLIDCIRKIADNNNIPFNDISKPYFNSDTTYFFDWRHLNYLGADKFTSEYYVPWIKELYGL